MTPPKKHDDATERHRIGCGVCGGQREIVGFCGRCLRNCCPGCYNASETVCNTCLDDLDATLGDFEEEGDD